MSFSFSYRDLITADKILDLSLQAMVLHGRVELLAHPLSQKYLQMKWNAYGKYFHLANLLVYSVFLFFVTLFSYELMYAKHIHLNNIHMNDTNNTLNSRDINESLDLELPREPRQIEERFQVTMSMFISGLGILGYVFLSGLKEILQAYQQKWHYLFEPINFLSWVLYVSAIIMTVPMCNGVVCGIHYSAASITIFVSWFNLLLLLQRFDQVCSTLIKSF